MGSCSPRLTLPSSLHHTLEAQTPFSPFKSDLHLEPTYSSQATIWICAKLSSHLLGSPLQPWHLHLLEKGGKKRNINVRERTPNWPGCPSFLLAPQPCIQHAPSPAEYSQLLLAVRGGSRGQGGTRRSSYREWLTSHHLHQFQPFPHNV